MLLLPGFAYAESIAYSPDITVEFDGVIVQDEATAIDSQGGTVIPVTIELLPDSADLKAYHRLPNGDQLLAFDTTLTLGEVTVQAGDVVRFNGSAFQIEFDASEAGVPSGSHVDALATEGDDLLLSFNTTVTLSGETMNDADLVQVTPSGFVRYFDSARAGVPAAMDLDGAAVDVEGRMHLSFDIGGTLGEVVFSDEDVLTYDPGTTEWVLAYDGNAQYAAWTAADLDALALAGDSDNDGIPDDEDNCILHPNPDQRDTNADGFGNRCDPDLDNDNKIDFADLAELKSRFFSSDADADLNGDQRVDFADLAIQKQMFFGPPGPSSQVP